LAGAGAFGTVYSWKLGFLYHSPVVAAVALWALRAEGSWAARRTTVLRLLVCMASAGALCVLLLLPAVLQADHTLIHLQKTGKPMGTRWAQDSVCLSLTGMPWARQDKESPVETPMSDRLQSAPIVGRAGLLADACFIGLGLLLLAKKRGWLALGLAAMIPAGMAGAAFFKWGMHVEWITWYFLPVIVPLVIFKATAIDDLVSIASAWVKRFHAAKGMRALAFATALFALLMPIASAQNSVSDIDSLLSHPYESNREAWSITRGKHEAWGSTAPSKVWTVYLWRHIHTYDPRADTYCRSAQALKAKMDLVDAADGELYVVIGQRLLTEYLNPDLMVLARDERYFEPLETFWATESIHTLEVKRYKKGSGRDYVPPPPHVGSSEPTFRP
jgi:hypothetical protein